MKLFKGLMVPVKLTPTGKTIKATITDMTVDVTEERVGVSLLVSLDNGKEKSVGVFLFKRWAEWASESPTDVAKSAGLIE